MVIFCPRRFLEAMERVVTFFGVAGAGGGGVAYVGAASGTCAFSASEWSDFEIFFFVRVGAAYLFGMLSSILVLAFRIIALIGLFMADVDKALEDAKHDNDEKSRRHCFNLILISCG